MRYLSDSNLFVMNGRFVVVEGRTSADTVLDLSAVVAVGRIFAAAKVLTADVVLVGAGAFFLDDGCRCEAMPGRVGCVSSSLSLASDGVTSSAESRCDEGTRAMCERI